MRKKLSTAIILLMGILFLSILACCAFHSSSSVKKSTVDETTVQSSTSTTIATATSSSSSEVVKMAYPDLSKYDQLSIKVSIDEQEMTILSNNKVIFRTIVSTGAPDSPTPTGTFVIEEERGDFFYNPSSGEGAYYWVSFKDHGVYLFHSVPTDEYGNEIPEEAARLGQPCSHGCVRMSREDAKWFYENIPEGISVTIS